MLAHLGMLQALGVVVLGGGMLAVILAAWGVHMLKSIRTHRNARKQHNG